MAYPRACFKPANCLYVHSFVCTHPFFLGLFFLSHHVQTGLSRMPVPQDKETHHKLRFSRLQQASLDMARTRTSTSPAASTPPGACTCEGWRAVPRGRQSLLLRRKRLCGESSSTARSGCTASDCDPDFDQQCVASRCFAAAFPCGLCGETCFFILLVCWCRYYFAALFVYVYKACLI